MEFWNDEIIEKSWEKLIELKSEIGFVLIGGWAVYLYTKLYKSKDIDIIVDYDALKHLRANYVMGKNERLRKYEVKLEEGFDIDVYVPKYSRLAIPAEDIMKMTTAKEGFTVPRPEVLLLLKLGALIDRKESIKGSKDAIDVAGMLFFANCDLGFFKELTIKYDLMNYSRALLSTIENFDPSLIKYLNLNQNGFSKLRKEYASEIRKIL
jgi:hypothetical protein